MSVSEASTKVSSLSLFRELVQLAWPITVSTLSFTVMTVVDTAFVGRLGPASLAGVGLGGIALWTVICFGFGLLRAVKVLVAQGVGAGAPGRHVLLHGLRCHFIFIHGRRRSHRHGPQAGRCAQP